MTELEKLLIELPHLHRVEITKVGRFSGKVEKYELSYYDTPYKSSPVYRYMDWTPEKCAKKLRRKLMRPWCRIGCCCCHE